MSIEDRIASWNERYTDWLFDVANPPLPPEDEDYENDNCLAWMEDWNE